MAVVGSSAVKAIKSAVKSASTGKFRHNRVDIYIRERNGSREIRVPWLPERIEYSSGGALFASYDIMNKGEVAVPTGTGLATVSWDSVFPGSGRNDDSMQRGTWKDPSTYHNILEDWRAKGTELNLMVIGYPINIDVFLEDYEAAPAGGFGDMEYRVTFKEARDLTITSTTQKTTTKTTTTNTKRSAPKTKSYTIKKGDCLWSIAQKQMGAGSKWKTLYEANKDIIEKTAKKYGRKSSSNGHWIYPGVTIQIPQ